MTPASGKAEGRAEKLLRAALEQMQPCKMNHVSTASLCSCPICGLRLRITAHLATPAANGPGEAGREEAPPNSLPSYGECALRVGNSKFIDKRVAEGGYGNEYGVPVASELHKFIHEYDDADPYRSAWFLHRLERLLDETRTLASTPQPGMVTVPREPTKDMLEEGFDAINKQYARDPLDDALERTQAVYRAMLDAAKPSTTDTKHR